MKFRHIRHMDEMAKGQIYPTPFAQVLKKNTNGQYSLLNDDMWSYYESEALGIANTKKTLLTRQPGKSLPAEATTMQEGYYIILGFSRIPYPCPRNNSEWNACPFLKAFIKDMLSKSDFDQAEFEDAYCENMGVSSADESWSKWGAYAQLFDNPEAVNMYTTDKAYDNPDKVMEAMNGGSTNTGSEEEQMDDIEDEIINKGVRDMGGNSKGGFLIVDDDDLMKDYNYFTDFDASTGELSGDKDIQDAYANYDEIDPEEKADMSTLYINFKITPRYLEYHKMKYTNRPVEDDDYYSVPIGCEMNEMNGYGYWYILNGPVAENVKMAKSTLPSSQIIGMPCYDLPFRYKGVSKQWPCEIQEEEKEYVKLPISYYDISKRLNIIPEENADEKEYDVEYDSASDPNYAKKLKMTDKPYQLDNKIYWDYKDDACTFVKEFYNGGKKVLCETGFELSGFEQSVMIKHDYLGTMMDNCMMSFKTNSNDIEPDKIITNNGTDNHMFDLTDALFIPNVYELAILINLRKSYPELFDKFGWNKECWTSTLYDKHHAYTMTPDGKIDVKKMNDNAQGVYMLFFPKAQERSRCYQLMGHNIRSSQAAESYAERAYDFLLLAHDKRNEQLKINAEFE